MPATILIIGAGVSGLTTGVVLAERGEDVVIVDDEPTHPATSLAAGAMCGPGFTPPDSTESRWETVAASEFRTLAALPSTGVRLVEGLLVAATDGPVPPVAEAYEPRPCEPDELPSGFPTGLRVRTPIVDMPVYLAYLRDRLEAAGGRLQRGHVERLDEAVRDVPVVINCAGVGARQLADDATLTASRGQHVVVTNPGVDTLYFQMTFTSSWTSWMPHGDRVVLGGVAHEDDWRLDPDPEITRQILARCASYEPRFAEAEVLDVRVGLRPARPTVRLETEPFGTARCVHNYGHGGMGVTWSWGCAADAAALAAVP